MTKSFDKVIGDLLVRVTINATRYFSATAMIYRRNRRGGKIDHNEYVRVKGKNYIFEDGGMCHQEIREYFPELSIFCDLHLSSLEGVPMHCISNGEHYVRSMLKGETDHSIETVMEHFRITKDQAKKLMADYKENGHAITFFFADNCERYRQEGKEALALLETLKADREY